MSRYEIDRRQLLALLGAGTMAGAAFGPGRLFAQTLTRLKYMFAFPSISNTVSNQTSIPLYYGMYKEAGLEPEFSPSSGGPNVSIQLVASGDQDIGSGVVEPVLERAAQGDDLGIVYFYNQIRRNNTVIVVNPGGPIQTLAGLAGKTIGVTALGSGPEKIIRLALEENGVNPETQVSFIDVGIGAQALTALRNGDVDAYTASIGTVSTMEALGEQFRQLPMPSWVNDIIGPGLFTSRRYLEANRATVVAVGRIVARSTVFVLNNPEAAIRIHWSLFPEQVPTGQAFDAALARTLVGMERQVEVLRFQDGDTVRKFGYMSPESIDRYLRVIRVRDRISDPGHYFTNDLVDEINDFDAQEMIDLARNFKAP
ncbi:MAG: ABC transporter substrate-binding protein [Rhodobacteraceae bacterium]|nr:ABC transporter substrate-binding protein [Paracoccaceae bacterium]